ncbi:hypothetical protein NL676_004973 [Syzygium grande]|nr:hypothetical protein NL676_004973 [Syzygium grande]
MAVAAADSCIQVEDHPRGAAGLALAIALEEGALCKASGAYNKPRAGHGTLLCKQEPSLARIKGVHPRWPADKGFDPSLDLGEVWGSCQD